MNLQLKKANNLQELYELNLPILIESKHEKYGWIFPIFLLALKQSIFEDDARWVELDDLLKKIKDYSKFSEIEQPKTNIDKHKLFNSILEIDFKDQEKYVTKAIESQRMRRRTVAFLVNAYNYRYGQAIFIERLFRKVPEFKNLRKIQIKLDNITKISDFWEQIAPEFIDSSGSISMSSKEIQQRITDKISICLQSQNIIFIFHVYDRCFPEILTDLILEFWQPIHGINDSD
ncbi:MAG: hypothetical protein HC815_39355, partial [Richelia sp. RM1_1_1]|nr:hypothetical protein [Richelia sp. RM1_1_1]